MLKNLLYIVFASFIFLMGYISEDFIALYETRPNQYPPYGKEVVDVNGTKFMRDIKDETSIAYFPKSAFSYMGSF